MFVLFPTMHYRMCLAKWDDPVLNADNSTTSAALPRVRLRFCFDVLALHLTPPQQGVFFLLLFGFWRHFLFHPRQISNLEMYTAAGSGIHIQRICRKGWSHMVTPHNLNGRILGRLSPSELWDTYETTGIPHNFSWAAYFKCSFICTFRIPWTHPICRWTINI